ncbi:MAG: hypothetical protein KF859_12725 [Phycisphaeraceae bacterium]|nr:hypothetical protein [Phycisphaeraceae bacterium]
MSEKSSAFAAACLSIGLANAWAPDAKADMPIEVTIASSLHGDVSNALFLLSNPDAGSGLPGFVISDPALAGGVVRGGPWLTCICGLDSSVTIDQLGTGYAMLGLTQMTDGRRSLVVTGNNLTFSYGLSFEEAFPGFSEADLIDDLLSGGGAGAAFLRANFGTLFTPHGEESTAVSFTVGAPYGSLTLDVAVVPAPGAAALISFGLLGVIRRRRPQ